MDAYDNHKDYLLAQTKKKEMTLTNFESQVRYHNHSVLPWLPSAPTFRLDAMLSEREFKSLIYKAMPDVWREKYEEHNTQHNSTLEQIMTFMERRYLAGDREKDPLHSNPHNGGNGGGRGRGRGRGRGNGRGRGRGGCGGRSRGNGNGNGNGGGKLKSTDTCPLPGHFGHTWGDCFQNIANPNESSRRNNGGGGGGNNRSNNRGNGGDAHVNEDSNQSNNSNSNNDTSSRSSNSGRSSIRQSNTNNSNQNDMHMAEESFEEVDDFEMYHVGDIISDGYYMQEDMN